MITRFIPGILLAAVSLFTMVARGQDKINTDLPDQTDGTGVVDPQTLQFETKFYYNKFSSGQTALISSSLLRYGLFKNVEARLLVEQGQERDLFISETTQGLYPLALSTKIVLLKDKAILPDIAFVSYLHMPLTSKKGNYGYWSPLFTLALEKELNKLTVGANGTFKQEAFEDKWIWQVSTDLKYELSDRLSFFAEYFAQYGSGESPLHNADGGALFYISQDCMIHLAFGHTLFSTESNYFGNAGFAFRIH